MSPIERVLRAETLSAAFRRRGLFGLSDLMGRCADILGLHAWGDAP